MEVEWRDLEEYPRYKVSEDGRVWDKEKDVEVSQMLSGIPQYYYCNINLGDGKRRLIRVHRLIAEAFCEGRSEEYNIVDHIDRNPRNNHSSNLRWTNQAINTRNRGVTLFVGEDETLMEWVRDNYPDDEYNSYSYLHRKMEYEGMSFEEAVTTYEEFLERGLDRRKVGYKGEERYLTDLCDEAGANYYIVSRRIRQGWEVWDALYNAPPANHYQHQFSFKWDREGVVNIWYKSKEAMQDHLRELGSYLVEKTDSFTSIVEILEQDHQERYRLEIDGIRGSIDELCRHFGKTRSAVETAMTRRGRTLEEALKEPRRSVKRVEVNGVPMTPKAMWEMFNINPKAANNVRTRRGASFEEVLEHFGVDTSDIEITY